MVNNYKTEEKTLDAREHAVRRKLKRAKAFWIATFITVVAGMGAFVYVASQPTGDEKYYVDHCEEMSGDPRYSSKVWLCPRVEWR